MFEAICLQRSIASTKMNLDDFDPREKLQSILGQEISNDIVGDSATLAAILTKTDSLDDDFKTLVSACFERKAVYSASWVYSK